MRVRVEITAEVMDAFFPSGNHLCCGEWHILNNGCLPGKAGPGDRAAEGSKPWERINDFTLYLCLRKAYGFSHSRPKVYEVFLKKQTNRF